MIEDLYCRRTIAECMRGGVAWVVSHVGLVTRRLWLPALIMSLVTSMTMALVSIDNSVISALDYHTSIMLMMLLVVALLLLAFATVYLYSSMYRLVCGVSWRQALRRCTVVLVLSCVLQVVWWLATGMLEVLAGALQRISVLSEGIFTTILLLLALALVVAVLVFFCPLVYLFTKYIVDSEETLGSIWRHYRFSLRYVGYLIAYVILAGIILAIVNILINSPLYIIMSAMSLSAAGVAYGDPAGLPIYVRPLSYVVCMVTTFVMVVSQLWAMVTTLYIYGCMESRRGRTAVSDAAADDVEG